jgi:hypothetical protein
LDDVDGAAVDARFDAVLGVGDDGGVGRLVQRRSAW